MVDSVLHGPTRCIHYRAIRDRTQPHIAVPGIPSSVKAVESVQPTPRSGTSFGPTALGTGSGLSDVFLFNGRLNTSLPCEWTVFAGGDLPVIEYGPASSLCGRTSDRSKHYHPCRMREFDRKIQLSVTLEPMMFTIDGPTLFANINGRTQ